MIALINPWSTPSAKKPLPMSLLALGGSLEGEYDYRIIDGNVDHDAVATVGRLHDSSALTAIGITVMPGPQLTHAVTLSRALNKRMPGVPIVWGGYFPSQHPDVCLRDPAVDYCVRGQGEHSFLALIRVLRDGGALADIAGLSYRESSSIRHNPIGPLTPLDALPMWPYERVEMGRYFHRHYLGSRVGTHHSSFGCPFGCSFCAVVAIAKRKWVAESPERVAAVLTRFKREHAADAVQFHDMDFFISEPRTAAIADRLESLEMNWWALGRVDELMRYRTATWQAMKRSRLKMVFCGAESGSTDTLQRMNKGGAAAAELTLELAKRMKEFGIVPEFSFVVGNPPNPEADLRQTLAFIRRLKTINPAAEIILYVYSPVAGGDGFEFAETLDEWTSDRWQAFSLRRDPRTPWSPLPIQQRVRDFETVLNAYYPTVTDTRLSLWHRGVLRTTAAWRYHSGVNAHPVELNLLQKVLHYKRPETTGF